MSDTRPRFGSTLGTLLTMIGVAVGLGNMWRFPYMVGEFGGTAFVVLYALMVVGICVPALMAEWTLGRETRRGTVGAFERAGLPFGRAVGWFFFVIVAASTAYYTNVVGWVVFHALTEAVRVVGIQWDGAAILPPDRGFRASSFLLQIGFTGLVLGAVAVVLIRGVERGTERVSRIVMPLLFGILILLIVRSLTLPGAGEGLRWYLGKFDPSAVDGSAAIAALGQAVFSLSLGGTFMVVYGSYLPEDAPLGQSALLTAAGDAGAGLLAGLAIFPAVFAFGMEAASGPGLLFETLPATFAAMPGGALFGLAFFLGLAGAAFLSDVAAFEVLVAGLTDNTGLSRRRAVGTLVGVAFLLSLVPMLNMAVFVPWDLTFGSGMQTLGALMAVLTVGWALYRGSERGRGSLSGPLLAWIRFGVPIAISAVGLWWVWTDLLPAVGSAGPVP